MNFTIAIDGPSASGKGTIARALVERFGFVHLDTGLLYRAVGAQVMKGAPAVQAARALSMTALEDPHLRSQAVAEAASRIASIPEVRVALIDFQRAFARRDGGAVLDGRDIGTVVCPEAELKLFVIADADIRAARRHRELIAVGHDVTLAQVLEDIHKRDTRDRGRTEAPLRPAPDAVRLDTSHMTLAQAIKAAADQVTLRLT